MTAITYRQSPTPSNLHHSSPSSIKSVIKFKFDKVRYATSSLDFPTINHSLPRWKESKRVTQFTFKENLDPQLTKKEIRIHQRVEILKSLEIPLNKKELKELLTKIPEIKTEFAKDFSENKSLIFPVKINKQSYRIEAHPRKEDKGVDIFLFSKKTNEISHGGFKIYFHGWSLTKAPKRLAVGVSRPEKFSDYKDTYVDEANFTDTLNASKLFGRLFKCSYFEDSDNQVDEQILIMKYCPQVLLDKLNDIIEVLVTKERMTDIEKLNFAINLVSALNYLHCQENTVHRDLKLENILLNKKGCPVICDFGFAAKSSNKEALTLFKGTVDYLPYEFFKNYPKDTQKNGTKRFDFSEWSEQQGYAIDIWSMGVILYVLFNLGAPSWFDLLQQKQVPLQAKLDNVMEKMEEFHKDEPDADCQGLRHLIWQMLHLDPLQRPQTSEILDKLTKIRDSLFPEDSYDLDYQFPQATLVRLDPNYPFQ